MDNAPTDVTIFEAKKLPGGINSLLLKTNNTALSIQGKSGQKNLSLFSIPKPGQPLSKKEFEPDEISEELQNIGEIHVCASFNESLKPKEKPIGQDRAISILSSWIKQAKAKSA